jgi:adenylate cyclase
MSLKSDILKKVKEIIDTTFVVEDVAYVPDIEDTKLTFGNKGLKFDATVLYIDINGSTEILNKHNKNTVAKIHMAYFHTIINIAKSLGGDVRSFNGDSMLVFFQGTTKNTLSNAVRAAMKMKYLITSEDGINPTLSKYSTIDFGIGMDHGDILSTKIGLGRDVNTKDLIWIGNSVNKSVRISELHKNPYNIGISSYVYSNLNDDVKYHITKNAWGQDQQTDMWTCASFNYNGTNEYYYYTSYHWSVE